METQTILENYRHLDLVPKTLIFNWSNVYLEHWGILISQFVHTTKAVEPLVFTRVSRFCPQCKGCFHTL